MRIILIAILFLFLECVQAQTDILTYHIVLNDSSSFTCKLISEIPNKIMHVQKADSSEEYILYKNINSVNIENAEGKFVNINTLSKSQLKDLRATQKTIAAHQHWLNCFIIKQAGDTLYGKVKHRRNYSSNNGANPWYNSDIVFTYPDDKEEVFALSEIQELSINGVKYLVLDGGMGYTDLYKVVIDGSCKLVYKEFEGYNTTTGWQGMAINTTHYSNDSYYVYYKNTLTRMRTIFSGEFGSFQTSAGFKGKCREIFFECPALIDKIENGDFKSLKLRQEVNEFNQGIEVK